MPDNIEIYKEFLRGNPQGINAIHLVNWEPLIQYGLKYLSRRDAVEDAVAEAFVLLYLNVGTFNDEIHIKKFLYNTVRKKCWNEARVLRRSAPLADTENVIDTQALESLDIQESIIYNQLITQAIVARLDQLPQQRRDDTRAHYIDSKSYEIIARERGVSVDTVRQNIDHALKALRKQSKAGGLTGFLKKIGFFFSKNAGS